MPLAPKQCKESEVLLKIGVINYFNVCRKIVTEKEKIEKRHNNTMF